MILLGTFDDSRSAAWLDCIADWHDFCMNQGLEPWEHLTTQKGGFFASDHLYQLRQGYNLRQQMFTIR